MPVKAPDINTFCSEFARKLQPLNGSQEARDAFLQWLYGERGQLHEIAKTVTPTVDYSNELDGKEVLPSSQLPDGLTKKKTHLTTTQITDFIRIQYIIRANANSLLEKGYSPEGMFNCNLEIFLSECVEIKTDDDYSLAEYEAMLNQRPFLIVLPENTKPDFENLKYGIYLYKESGSISVLIVDHNHHHTRMSIQTLDSITWPLEKTSYDEDGLTFEVDLKKIFNDAYDVLKTKGCLDEEFQKFIGAIQKAIKEDHVSQLELPALQASQKKQTRISPIAIIYTVAVAAFFISTMVLAATGTLTPFSFMTDHIGYQFFADHSVFNVFAQGALAACFASIPGGLYLFSSGVREKYAGAEVDAGKSGSEFSRSLDRAESSLSSSYTSVNSSLNPGNSQIKTNWGNGQGTPLHKKNPVHSSPLLTQVQKKISNNLDSVQQFIRSF